MSKYLKSGSSRYLKSHRESTSATPDSFKQLTEVSTGNEEGYTEQDLHLFDQLAKKTQTTTPSLQVGSRPQSNYHTPYTQGDIDIFVKLAPDQKSSLATSSDPVANNISSSRIKIMEFTD